MVKTDLKKNSRRKVIAAKYHVVDCDSVIQPLFVQQHDTCCNINFWLPMRAEALAWARNFTTSTSNIWIIFPKRWRHTVTLACIWRFEVRYSKRWGPTLIYRQRSEPDQWSSGERSSWIFSASLFLLLSLLCFSLGNLVYVMCTINFEIDYMLIYWLYCC